MSEVHVASRFSRSGLAATVLIPVIVALATAGEQGEWQYAGTPTRSLHVAVRDPVANRIIVFGGFDNGVDAGSPITNHVWELTFGPEPTWRKLSPIGTPPTGRIGMSAVFDGTRNRVVIFGGSISGNITNETWALSLTQPPTWVQIAASNPPPVRAGHVAVYDPSGDRMVVSGGLNHSEPQLGDLWQLTFSGTPIWTTLSASGTPPPPLTSSVAVYDAVRDRMVLFGGETNEGNVNQTWELSLGVAPAWTLLAPGGLAPPELANAAATYDPTLDRMLVFGGVDGTASISSAMWALTFSPSVQWSQVAASGPAADARRDHTITYLAAPGRAVVMGGWDGQYRFFNDLPILALEGASNWTQASPELRERHTVVSDRGDRLILFGGTHNNIRLNDTWELRLDGTARWSQMSPVGAPPLPRSGHSAIYDYHRNRMVIFGGQSGAINPPLNDVWELSLGSTPTWTQLFPVGTLPAGRYLHSAIYDPVAERMLIFGGRTQSTVNEVWSLCLAGTPAWTQLAPSGGPPVPRWGHTAIYDPLRRRMVAFGGEVQPGSYLADVWSLSLDGGLVWTSQTPTGTPPSARGFHTAGYDPYRDAMTVFGGVTYPYVLFNDVWRLSLAGSSSWQQLTPVAAAGFPIRRYNTGAAYDAERDQMVIVAGHKGSGYLADVWRLDWGVGLNQDVTPPAPVTLGAAFGETRAALSWISPGDDGNLGTATAYDLRRSSTPITACNFLGATPVTTGAPAPPGVEQCVEITFPCFTTNYFALRTRDEANNWSLLSNVPSGHLCTGDIDPVCDDGIAPAPVVDLAATFGRFDTAVSWTAVGDDGATTGLATEYVIRRSNAPITQSNWDFAQVVASGAPQAPGTLECVIVGSLQDCTAHYFAIKTRDEVSNWSAISNVAMGSTACSGNAAAACGIEWSVPKVESTDLPAMAELVSSNPLRGQGVVRYAIPASHSGDRIDLSVFDLAGRRARTIVQGLASPGRFEARWDQRSDDGGRVEPGVYFVRLRLGGQVLTRTAVVLR